MQPGGWFFMITSCGIIIGLFIYSMFRTLSSVNKEEANSDQSEDPKN